MQLQYTMGLKSTSNRMKHDELIITFLRLAVVLGDFENWTVFSFGSNWEGIGTGSSCSESYEVDKTAIINLRAC